MSFTKNLVKKQLFRVLRKNKEKKKLKKKLHLVLDLDHTLVHSSLESDLSQGEKYLIEEVDFKADLWRYIYKHNDVIYDYYIKLRPFVREFLEEANKLFSMSIYTMGSLSYAQGIVNIIDPTKVYFGDRVITREQSPNMKSLYLVAADKRRVVILDDTRDVWPYDKRNLLQISKYIYLRKRFNLISSYAEEKRDESQCSGPLANVLQVLKSVHKRFQYSKDLRSLIREPLETW